MKIDIAISFNDVNPPDNICFVNKKLSYYEQLIILIKSIKLNWNADVLPFEIFIHYSRELAKEKQNYLKSLGCQLIFNPNELQEYYNRENIYGHNTDGDYTLILDTDMVVLKTPTFDYSKDMYMRATENQVLNEEQWKKLYLSLNINFQKSSLKNNFYSHHFNNGCVFIKNDKKAIIYNYLMSNDYKSLLKIINKFSRHFSPQITYSLLLKTFNWGYLNKMLNAFTPDLKQIENEEIIHYLGTDGYSDLVKDLIKKIKEKWQMVYIK